ncbi:hypothetical protein [Ileibacterium valens]|uniref:hypothetical protein n=1 Tax=Ileibacterium valens TaxID=1862668 RepID=UPI0009671457|nr:hypothetical protein [Ileibacterium valens]OLU37321.1 hypothetical protein BM735_10920 [Erysipelotrichaceae bacterium NYU-BL-F16]
MELIHLVLTSHIESLCVLEYDPNVKKQQWIKPAKEFTNRPTSSKNKKIKFDSAKSVKKSGRPMKYKKNHH